jgi:chromosome segregation ATPase
MHVQAPSATGQMSKTTLGTFVARLAALEERVRSISAQLHVEEHLDLKNVVRNLPTVVNQKVQEVIGEITADLKRDMKTSMLQIQEESHQECAKVQDQIRELERHRMELKDAVKDERAATREVYADLEARVIKLIEETRKAEHYMHGQTAEMHTLQQHFNEHLHKVDDLGDVIKQLEAGKAILEEIERSPLAEVMHSLAAWRTEAANTLKTLTRQVRTLSLRIEGCRTLMQSHARQSPAFRQTQRELMSAATTGELCRRPSRAHSEDHIRRCQNLAASRSPDRIS